MVLFFSDDHWVIYLHYTQNKKHCLTRYKRCTCYLIQITSLCIITHKCKTMYTFLHHKWTKVSFAPTNILVMYINIV